MTQITSGLVIWNSTNAADSITYSSRDKTITFGSSFYIEGSTTAPKVYNNCSFKSGSTIESYTGTSTSVGSISCNTGNAIIVSPGKSGDSLTITGVNTFGSHSINSSGTTTIEDGCFLVLGCPEIILTSNGFDGNGNPIAVTYSGKDSNPIIAATENGGKGKITINMTSNLIIKNKARVHLGAYQFGNGTLEIGTGATLTVGDGVNDCELNIGSSNKVITESKLVINQNVECTISNSTINIGGSGNGSSGTGGKGEVTITRDCYIIDSIVFCGGPGGMNGENGSEYKGAKGGTGGTGGTGGNGTLTISSFNCFCWCCWRRWRRWRRRWRRR